MNLLAHLTADRNMDNSQLLQDRLQTARCLKIPWRLVKLWARALFLQVLCVAN